MTATAQDHPELDALLTRVREQVKSCELEQAILVDDQLEIELTLTQWNKAVAQLKDDDRDAYTKLHRFIGTEGTGNVEEWPDDKIRAKAIEIVNGSKSAAAIETLKQGEFKEQSLIKLVDLLRRVGLEPICRTRITDAPRDGKLYFLDYRMQGNDQTAGLDASLLLQDLVKREGEVPPSAILMSRGVNQHPTQPEWEKVAKDSGYFRFNFRYLDKGKLEAGEMAFLFFLHELLESYPLGKEYYSQLATVRDTAQSAANAAFARIRQLSPTEFSIFAGKHLEDDSGRRASRHMLELFLGLLDAEVKDNESLETSFRSFAKMLKTTPMLASKDKDTHALHQLHCRLLYDRSKWVLAGPIMFGDMYRKDGDPNAYYIVITPECDLELRYEEEAFRWWPKVDEILMLRGEVTLRMPEKKDFRIIHPFVSEKGQQWITWSLHQRAIAQTADLVHSAPQQAAGSPLVGDNGLETVPNRYHKWGRLRSTEAEHIQQRFASDLTAVGIDDISGNTHARDVELWDNRNTKAPVKIADLVIVETANLKDFKKPYLALGEGYELTLCAEQADEIIVSFADLVKMRKPSIRTDFLALCQKGQLYLVDTDGEPLRLVRSKQAVKDGWKPPEPKVKVEGGVATEGKPVGADGPESIEQQAARTGGRVREQTKIEEIEEKPPFGNGELPPKQREVPPE